jgi:hypothetical protein
MTLQLSRHPKRGANLAMDRLGAYQYQARV